MADWWNEFKDATPTQAPQTQGAPATNWWNEFKDDAKPKKDAYQLEQEKHSKNLSKIGGVANTMARGMFVVGNKIPQSEAGAEFEKEHPWISKAAKFTGGAASAVPVTMAAAYAGGPSLIGQILMQGLGGAGLNAADTATSSDPNKSYGMSAILGALGGAAGPVAGKILSPGKLAAPKPVEGKMAAEAADVLNNLKAAPGESQEAWKLINKVRDEMLAKTNKGVQQADDKLAEIVKSAGQATKEKKINAPINLSPELQRLAQASTLGLLGGISGIPYGVGAAALPYIIPAGIRAGRRYNMNSVFQNPQNQSIIDALTMSSVKDKE